MASPPHTSESDEEFHSLSTHEMVEQDDDESVTMEPPTHPVPSMQAAFEESILESTEDDDRPKSIDATAEARRQNLLETGHYDDSWMTRWKQKPGAEHHPLLKLMAQIVFGMHLLQQQAAKSDEEVVKILQTHVDEVDNFLEKTMEDFDLALKDIEERIKFLKLPMTHLDVFETMLEDKKFRTQLLDGNDKIEKIIERTTRAMNAALLDVQNGNLATKELGKYLEDARDDWPKEKVDLSAIYSAMRGNEQGWKQCLKDLHMKGIALRDNLAQLALVIGEMSRIAAAVSRRQRPHSRSESIGRASVLSTVPRSKFSNDSSRSKAHTILDKPLPREPNVRGGAVQPPASKQHPVPFAQRYESPRPTPASPTRLASRSSTIPPRPKTSGSMAAREARNASKNSTADLADFLTQSGPAPLRSNPPGEMVDRASIRSASTTIIRRPQGQSAVDVVDHAKTTSNGPSVTRSATLGANDISVRPHSRGSETTLGHSRTKSKDQSKSPETLAKSKRESLAGTRFARRLSVRKSHLKPPTAQPVPAQPLHSPPEIPAYGPTAVNPIQTTDSAYSSGTDKKDISPTDSKLKPISESQQQQNELLRAPSPRLGLFPATEPLTPSAASFRTASQNFGTDGSSPARAENSNGVGSTGALPEKPAQMPSRQNTQTSKTMLPLSGEKKGRAFSLRKMFGHRKQASKNVLTYSDIP